MPKESSGSVRVFFPRLSAQEVVTLLRQRVPELGRLLPLKLVVLFGSYARGNYTVASDVDVVVVYQGPPREDAYGLVKKTFGLPRLEPHVYAEEQYLAHREVIERMLQGGKVIYEPGGPGLGRHVPAAEDEEGHGQEDQGVGG